MVSFSKIMFRSPISIGTKIYYLIFIKRRKKIHNSYLFKEDEREFVAYPENTSQTYLQERNFRMNNSLPMIANIYRYIYLLYHNKRVTETQVFYHRKSNHWLRLKGKILKYLQIVIFMKIWNHIETYST